MSLVRNVKDNWLTSTFHPVGMNVKVPLTLWHAVNQCKFSSIRHCPHTMNRQAVCKELVDWTNKTLRLRPPHHLKTIDDFKTGVALLQLLHAVDSTVFDFSLVDQYASTDYHFRQNLKVLQQVLERKKISRSFVIDNIVQGDKMRDLQLFVSFIVAHVKKQDIPASYDPELERKRASDRRLQKLRSRHHVSAGGIAALSSAASMDDALSMASANSAAYSSLSQQPTGPRGVRRRALQELVEDMKKWQQQVQQPPLQEAAAPSALDSATPFPMNTVPRLQFVGEILSPTRGGLGNGGGFGSGSIGSSRGTGGASATTSAAPHHAAMVHVVPIEGWSGGHKRDPRTPAWWPSDLLSVSWDPAALSRGPVSLEILMEDARTVRSRDVFKAFNPWSDFDVLLSSLPPWGEDPQPPQPLAAGLTSTAAAVAPPAASSPLSSTAPSASAPYRKTAGAVK
jgi:hypothetical protein